MFTKTCDLLNRSGRSVGVNRCPVLALVLATTAFYEERDDDDPYEFGARSLGDPKLALGDEETFLESLVVEGAPVHEPGEFE